MTESQFKKYLKERTERTASLKFFLVALLALAGTFGFVWLTWFFLYYK